MIERKDIKNLVYRIRFVSCYSPSPVMNLSDAILLNLFLLLTMRLLQCSTYTLHLISVSFSFPCKILNEMSTILHKYFHMCTLNFDAHIWKKKYVIHMYVFRIQGAHLRIYCFLLFSTAKYSNIFTIVCPRLLFSSPFDEF